MAQLLEKTRGPRLQKDINMDINMHSPRTGRIPHVLAMGQKRTPTYSSSCFEFLLSSQSVFVIFPRNAQ